MYGYIYKTTNKINGTIYIGKRKGKFTSSYKGSGKYLRRALNKYGDCNFSVEVIEYCETLEIQNEREQFWIAYYKNLGVLMYNISLGGDGGDTYIGLSDEDREIRVQHQRTVSKTNHILYRSNYEDGYRKAWETRRRNGTDRLTAEQRRHLSEVHKGKKLPKEVIDKIVSSRKWYKHSDETRRKISEGNKGRIVSEETRKKLSASNKLRTGVRNSFYGKTHSDETKKYIGSFNKERFADRIWVNNGNVNKRVLRTELSEYKKLGFFEGRIKWGRNHLP